MKKIRIAVMVALLPLLLSGCLYTTLNDAESGEIVIGELKRPFQDGVYCAYSAYLNNDGYCAVMKVSVNNNMITAINFDYADTAMHRFSRNMPGASAEAVQSFKTTIKNLTSIVIADQEYLSIRSLATDKMSKDFLALIVLIYPNLQSGDTSVQALVQSESYTASSAALYNGYRPTLTVEYTGNAVSLINFSMTDDNGNVLETANAPEGTLPKDSAYTYANIIQYINTVPDDKQTLYKSAPSSEWNFLFNMYNALTSDIREKHVPANIDVTSVF